MSWALDWLQLPHDADERTIKRAYAARLKTTRPDSDPDGFQQLHEAYQAALAWSRYRDTFADDVDDDADSRDAVIASAADASADDAPEHDMPEDDMPDGAYRTVLSLDALLAATGAPSTPGSSLDTDDEDPYDADAGWPHTPAADTRPARTGPPPLPSMDETAGLDIDALCAAIIEQACVRDERSLLEWLHQRRELWSLQVKPRVGAYLIASLHTQLPPIGRDAFDGLLQFFGLDQVGSGQDAYTLQVLGERMQLAWEQVPGREHALAQRVTATTGVRLEARQIERMLAVLRGPYNVFFALCRSLIPTDPSRFRALLQTLGFGRQPLADGIHLDQATFWSRVGDRERMSRLRLAACLFRCAIYATPLALVAMRYVEMGGEPSLGLAVYWLYAFAGMAALWAGWVSSLAYLRWQGAPEGAVTFAPLLRLLWVPVLAVLAMVTLHVLDASVPGSIIAFVAVFTALSRYARRRVGRFRHFGWVVVLSFVLARSALPSLAFGDFAVVSALFLWALDLWFHRHRVRWRR